MSRSLLVAGALLCAAAGAKAQDFRPVAQHIASAWQRGDVTAVLGQLARAGVSLDVSGERVGPLTGRQAASALRHLFDERQTVETRVGTAKELPGQPRRAWVELTWITRSRGTSIPESSTVFVALELERDRWLITEIRLLPR